MLKTKNIRGVLKTTKARNVTHTPKNRCYFQNTETENALEDHTD